VLVNSRLMNDTALVAIDDGNDANEAAASMRVIELNRDEL